MHSEEQARQRFEELGAHIYTALRDGGLDAEPLLELAALLEEWDESTPTARELLDPATAPLISADLARLGESLLRDVNYIPTFALEPRLWTPLVQALEIVERDVRTSGISGTLRLATYDWDIRGHAWVEYQGLFHGNGIPPDTRDGVEDALAEVADTVQETIMELTWKVWPVCTSHDRGVYVRSERGTVVWWCTGDGGHTLAPVGQLP
ncbi:hypothetical protein ACIBIZ_18510 [Nonomuraea spiralis]|uniref:hypothetical protein n=1 Tax=Nonomuraea spiralis TaxID=46182 RepID=UPI0037BDF5F0